MDERKLRRKARIGSLKWLGVIMGGAALIGLVTGIISFFSAAQNTGGPQEVTISQIVDGEIGGGKHVQVSGVAMYDVGYEKTEDGKTTKTYYYLVDYEQSAVLGRKLANGLQVSGLRQRPGDGGHDRRCDLAWVLGKHLLQG